MNSGNCETKARSSPVTGSVLMTVRMNVFIRQRAHVSWFLLPAFNPNVTMIFIALQLVPTNGRRRLQPTIKLKRYHCEPLGAADFLHNLCGERDRKRSVSMLENPDKNKKQFKDLLRSLVRHDAGCAFATCQPLLNMLAQDIHLAFLIRKAGASHL